MKFFRLIFFLFYFISFQAFAETGLKIYNWKENIDLNSTGKSTEISIDAIVKLPANQEIAAFSISFQNDDLIKIKEVKVDNKTTDFSFKENVLKIYFKDGKANNQRANIYFSYDEIYDKVNKFIRAESIYVPEFAAGANAEVTINVPDFLESVTFNPNINKVKNSFFYKNIVPANGVKEIVKLTPADGAWDVDLKIKISSNQNMGKISMILPQYFQDPLQRVENYLIVPNISPTKQAIRKDGIALDFNVPTSQMYISSKAKVFTGAKNRSKIIRKPENYANYTAEEALLLTSILEQIKQNPEYVNLPLYVKIGKFVHNFIKYDDSYVGKLPTVKQILNNPVGVCTEYAKLYGAIARVAGIPNAILYGGACGNDDKCEGHSWNLIYFNNEWLQVDATWDLMSGIVSSSHVYLIENNLQSVAVNFEYLEGTQPQKIQSNFDFNMKNLK